MRMRVHNKVLSLTLITQIMNEVTLNEFVQFEVHENFLHYTTLHYTPACMAEDPRPSDLS